MQLIYTFPYMHNQIMHQLIIPIAHKHSPIAPIIKLLGMNAARVYDQLKSQPHEMISYPTLARRPMFSLTPEPIQHWLTSIKRHKDPQLLQHLQLYYTAGLNQLLEETQNQTTPRETPMPQYTAQYTDDEATARAHLAQHNPIYLDTKPLGLADRLRLLLNQLGVINWDDIHYLVEQYEGIILLRPAKIGSKQPYEIWKVDLTATANLNYKTIREGGYDVAPIFFLKYPHLYDFKCMDITEYNKEQDQIQNQLAGLNFATWYTADFQQKVLERLDCQARAEQKRLIQLENQWRNNAQQRQNEFALQFLAPM